uniref:uncharacterized protein LOC128931891 n=1 Tax=Callithrix jacchus TaxID=9483 RepID=UPI0023DD2506|nr:uncharacterized protein LOC128931891 [Callithrix jacchus]
MRVRSPPRSGQHQAQSGTLQGVDSRCSLFKRPAESHELGPHFDRKLAGLGSHLLGCGSGSGCGRRGSAPAAPGPLALPGAPALSRSLSSPRLPRSLVSRSLFRSLSSALSSSLSFFFLLLLPLPRRRQAPAPPPVALAGRSRSALFPARSSRPDPARLAASPAPSGSDAGLRGSWSRGCRRFPPRLLARLSSSGTPRAWWRLLPGGRQLIPAASRTPGGCALGSVRSVSTGRRGPGSGHRENRASGCRPPACAPGSGGHAADPSPRLKPCWRAVGKRRGLELFSP